MNSLPSSCPSSTTSTATFQHGVTLIELLVGITIGLLTIAVATGTLMISRGVSGTVSDASQLQQQASYAFRVLGQQLRQAGSMRLNLNAESSDPAALILPTDAVAFIPAPSTQAVTGIDSPSATQYALSVAFANYSEQTFANPTGASLLRDCLGQSSFPIIKSDFAFDASKGELKCLSASDPTAPQPILRNVADFQVRYFVQTANATGIPTIQKVNAATVGTNWTSVFGVEVCLVLYGDETINMPPGSKYKGCDGADIVMTTLPVDTTTIKRRNRMHVVFRNVYQLRSQGLTG